MGLLEDTIAAIRPADAEALAALGFAAVLVGETLVTATDPAAVVAGLRVVKPCS